MTCRASKAYACVAYRIMAYEKEEPSEEYLNMLMGILMDFYTAQEIQKIYDKMLTWKSDLEERRYLIYTRDFTKDPDTFYLPIFIVIYL